MPFLAVHGVVKARILKWFAIPFPVDHILSDLSTMTHPSWIVLWAWLSFIELDKADNMFKSTNLKIAGASLVAQLVKNLPAKWETGV